MMWSFLQKYWLKRLMRFSHLQTLITADFGPNKKLRVSLTAASAPLWVFWTWSGRLGFNPGPPRWSQSWLTVLSTHKNWESNSSQAAVVTEAHTEWIKKEETSVTRSLLISMISVIDFSVSLLINWLKIRYYTLWQLAVKQKLHSTQSSFSQELHFDQWRLQLRFLSTIGFLSWRNCSL